MNVCGPSAPPILGFVNEEVQMTGSGWCPVDVEENIGVISFGCMMGSNQQAVIWRVWIKSGLIKQFIKYMACSDLHYRMTQFINESDVDGALIVPTTQELSLNEVRKEINFCMKTNIKVLGVV